MAVKHELWTYDSDEKVWVGKYQNSHNLPHWHADCELLYVEKGEIDIFCEGKSHSLREGQSFFIDGEQVHFMQARRRETLLIVIVFDHSIIDPFRGNYLLSSPLLNDKYDVPDLYRQLRTELTEKKIFYRSRAILLVATLMTEIFRGEKIQVREYKPAQQNFKNLLREIDEKYEFFTLDDGAEFMHMNPSYFSRFFHKAAGMPFVKYINHIKIEKAVALLKSRPEIPVAEVSARCGFYTIRNFNRNFKNLTGYAPQQLPEHFAFGEASPLVNAVDADPTLPETLLIESSGKR